MAKSNQQKEQERQEQLKFMRAMQLKFMRDPNEWPRWPLLPMKRRGARGQFPDCGFLVTGQGPVIHRAAIYQVEVGTRWDSFSREMYESFERLYDSGWEID